MLVITLKLDKPSALNVVPDVQLVKIHRIIVFNVQVIIETLILLLVHVNMGMLILISLPVKNALINVKLVRIQ